MKWSQLLPSIQKALLRDKDLACLRRKDLLGAMVSWFMGWPDRCTLQKSCDPRTPGYYADDNVHLTGVVMDMFLLKIVGALEQLGFSCAEKVGAACGQWTTGSVVEHSIKANQKVSSRRRRATLAGSLGCLMAGEQEAGMAKKEGGVSVRRARSLQPGQGLRAAHVKVGCKSSQLSRARHLQQGLVIKG
ncbi:hypothetical protein NDU88_003437 [Pleurodeles waltl]|uniref:Uncharacterized protein n=1 Tax=Pleurodeles waltl TaxID=8319 RepID=A0AAV7TP45_PLEWA|nr:hypothetical protein NDU88_003437 [Pleurodeles waltl]